MAIMEAIATQYLEADAASITFSSIPSTYEHLTLSVGVRSTQAAVYHAFLLQLGTGGGAADSGANYSDQYVFGNSTTVAAGVSGETGLYISLAPGTSNETAYYGPSTATLFDYANTNKNTSFWCDLSTGSFGTTGHYVEFVSGSWDNTGAVDLIKILPYSAGNILRGSEVTLYGIKSS